MLHTHCCVCRWIVQEGTVPTSRAELTPWPKAADTACAASPSSTTRGAVRRETCSVLPLVYQGRSVNCCAISLRISCSPTHKTCGARLSSILKQDAHHNLKGSHPCSEGLTNVLPLHLHSWARCSLHVQWLSILPREPDQYSFLQPATQARDRGSAAMSPQGTSSGRSSLCCSLQRSGRSPRCPPRCSPPSCTRCHLDMRGASAARRCYPLPPPTLRTPQLTLTGLARGVH